MRLGRSLAQGLFSAVLAVLLLSSAGCGGGGGSTPTPTQPTAPVITTQPAAQTVVEGASASFTVTATGNGTLSYQWQKGGVDLAGKTSATLSINPVALTDAGSYAVKVTNTLSGSSLVTTSAAATLTVNAAATSPAITTQPAGQTVLEGGSASFTVAATGNGTLSYQWQKGGVDLVGKTSATLSISPVALGDAGSYAVKVTNSLNGTTATTTSGAATLTVNAVASVPVLTTQPAGQTVLQGGSASFTVAAAGNGILTYQWQKGGVDLAGKTSATLSLNPVALTDAGDYTAIVTNSLNGTTATATSSAATLTVTPQVATHLVVAGYPTPTVAGVSHAFTVTALDALDHVVSGFTGTVQITSDDPQAVLPAAATFAAGDAGVKTLSASFRTAGTRSLAATQATNSAVTGSQTGISVNPAAVTTLVVAGYPASSTAGQANSLHVRSFDAYGNQATAYTGTVHFTSTDGTAVLPADYAFQASDAGDHTFSVTLNTAGPQSITATDTVNAALTGTQSGIVVTAQAPTISVQPQTQTVVPPDSATFTVVAQANGGGTLTYVWKKNGTAIPGATSASYTVSSTEFSTNSDAYSVTVSEGALSTDSNTVYATASVTAPTYAGDPTPVPSRPITVLPSFNVDAVKYPNGAFRLGYDESLKDPVWSAYVNFPVFSPYPNSTADYTADTRLAAPQVGKDDYTGIYTGGANFADSYDRGHMVPRADISYRYTSQAGDDATMMSNLVPQISQLNQQTWQKLEDAIGGTGGGTSNGLTSTKGRIWVYTGSVFPASPTFWNSTVQPGLKIAIPEGCYKIVVHEVSAGHPEVLAMLMPNEWGLTNSTATLTQYVTSVSRIEALTGLDFFPALSTVAPGLDIPTWKATVDVRGWGTPFEQTTGPNVHVIQPSYDITVDEGATVDFVGATTPNSASQAGTTVPTTTWNFGDGSPTTTGTTTSHVYSVGGSYSVTFAVTDSLGGTNTLTRVVRVVPPTSSNTAPTTNPATIPDQSTTVDHAVTVNFR